MRSIHEFNNVYLYQGIVDFRKSISGLSTMVEQQLNLSPFSDALFIFIAKDRKKLKLLYWDKSGFALWTKVLEEEKFILPRNRNADTKNITPKELERLLDGFDIYKIKPHKNLIYSRVS